MIFNKKESVLFIRESSSTKNPCHHLASLLKNQGHKCDYKIVWSNMTLLLFPLNGQVL